MNRNVLSSGQIHNLKHALQIAAETHDEHATAMHNLAKALKAGKKHALFPKGKPGVVAAEAIAKGHEDQAKDKRELRDLLEGANGVWLEMGDAEED